MQFGNHLIHNIYYMLAYAFEQLPDEFYEKLTAGEKFDNIFDLLAYIFVVRLNKQIKQGLHREYLDFKEELPVLRGRIDVAETIQTKFARRRTVICEYDDLSVNNIFNRIIRTAGEFLLRSGNLNEIRVRALNKCMVYLQNIEPIPPEVIRWDTLRYSRNNRSYKELLNVCRFILTYMLPSTEMGNNNLSKYWADKRIYSLYESFIRAYYQKHYPKLHPSANHVQWAASEDDRKNLPGMRTDITLHGDHQILIIDAKYYDTILTKGQYGAEGLRSSHIYQIFSYVMNQAFQEQKDVSGILLYASTKDENSYHNEFTIAGHSFTIDTLNLNQNFSDISAHLDSFVRPLIF